MTEVETGWYCSKLPEAVVTGTEEAEDFVLVGAHYCSWEVGVTDNATGNAVLLEMARILMDNRSQLKRSVRFCWWPGHSHGRYSGSTWYADTFFEQLRDHCITYHNIDSPGVKGATMYVARHTSPEIQSFCRSAIASLTGQVNAQIHRPSRAADQSFIAMGVPSFSCYPFLPQDHPDRRPWTGGCANAWWWHSSEDTLDKADVDVLTLDTKISACAVGRLCNADILPIDAADLAFEIKTFAAEFTKLMDSHLDTSVFTERADRFLKVTKRLSSVIDGTRNGGHTESINYQRINRMLMKVSRIVNPVVYSKGGSFLHDAAEWSPVMRNSKSSTFPGLAQALLLETLKGSREYGFLRAQLVRELNRVSSALKEATTLCARTLDELGGL